MKDSPERIHYSLLKLLDRLERHIEESPSESYAEKIGEVKSGFAIDNIDIRPYQIASMYYDKKSSKNIPTIAPARNLREHILSLSLYPNVYNKRYLEKSIGSE